MVFSDHDVEEESPKFAIVLDALPKLRGRADFDHFVAFFANKFHCKYFQRPTPTS